MGSGIDAFRDNAALSYRTRMGDDLGLMSAPSEPPATVNDLRRLLRQTQKPRTPPRAAGPALAALVDIPRRRAELDRQEDTAITAALNAGASWHDIADALGLGSRQAARQHGQRLHARVTAPADGTAEEAGR